MSKKKISFEEKLERLGFISEKLESTEVHLEDVLKYYEEGVLLTKELLTILNESELKVNELKKDLDLTFIKFEINSDKSI